MAILSVSPISTFLTIASAISAAVPGDTIVLESGYSNETAIVTQSGLTVEGGAGSTGITLQLATGVATLSLTGLASIQVLDALDGNGIVGNAGNNLIVVSGGADSVDGGPGTDRLVVDYGLATGAVTGDSTSNFTEAGGGGRSVTITGGVENFTVTTGSGADTITTGAGDDIIDVGAGDNTVTAGDGDNVVFGGNDADTITTGSGNDFIDAGAGANIVVAGGGDNRVVASAGANTITTGAGNDSIDVGAGTATIEAGAGADVTTVQGGLVTVNSDAGTDRLVVDYSTMSANVFALIGGSLAAGYSGFVQESAANRVEFQATESFAITTGSGNDFVETGDGVDVLTGNSGDDTLISGNGDDLFNGGAGNDSLNGGAGTDTALYSGRRSDYTISYDAGGFPITVVDNRLGSPDGTDTLTAIELARFANSIPTGLTISGTPAEAQVLVATGLTDEDGLGVVAYRWQANGTDIAGATGSTFTLTQGQVGRAITVVASYTDQQGTAESVTSSATALVANVNDTPIGLVTIVGTPAEDQVLTASNTLTDEDGLGVVAYQWQANGTDIAGATGSTFTLTQGQVGRAMTVVASYTDQRGTAESVTSSATALVATTVPPAPSDLTLALASDSGTVGDGITNDATPTLTGTAEAGSTVTLTDASSGSPVVLGTTLADDAGQWSFTPTTALADGARSVTATATDAAGNVSPASAALALTIDTAVPTLTTGSQIPNDNTPTISGRATPGSTVALLANGLAISSAIANATTGIFEVTANTPLALGLNSLTTTQTTASGTSASSVPIIVFVVQAPEQGISTTGFSSADIGSVLDQGARLAFIGGTEAVLLTDSTLSVGNNTNQATIQRLYEGLLGRSNDTGGITQWDDQLNDGVSKAAVAIGFLNSAEYVASHPVQTDEQFVTSLYQGLLGRAAELDGLAFWTEAMAQGSSRGDIVIGIADSDEAKSHLAATTAQVYVPNDAGTLTHVLYETGLGREVELPALAFWKAAYDVVTPLQLTALIASSPEFTAYHAGQNNDAYVNSLYQAGLGRPAEVSGMASWTSLLNSGGATRTDVLLAVATSSEAGAHLTYNLSS